MPESILARGETIRIKFTGYVRQMDALGRITLPKKVRDELGMKLVKGKAVCLKCVQEIKRMVKSNHFSF